jgi:hypothetical protein
LPSWAGYVGELTEEVILFLPVLATVRFNALVDVTPQIGGLAMRAEVERRAQGHGVSASGSGTIWHRRRACGTKPSEEIDCGR